MTSVGNRLTLVFHSDFSVTYDGFTVSWESVWTGNNGLLHKN